MKSFFILYYLSILKKARPHSPCKKSCEACIFYFQIKNPAFRLESANFFQSSICFVNSSGTGSKFSFFISIQFQFNDFFDTVFTG